MIINMKITSTTQQSTKYTLTLSTSSNANVIISKDSNNFVGVTNSDGLIVFNNLEAGIWTINISKGSLSVTEDINIQEDTSSNIILNSIPEFTYKTSAGTNAKYEIYNANNVNITNNPETQGNWKIKFLESGILTINRLNGASNGIDVFCVGGGGAGHKGPVATNAGSMDSPGGGGGGGGGYTTTKKGVSVQTGEYTMSVGGSGGTTYAFKGANIEVSAKNGGNGSYNGGNGGSGGGCGTWTSNNDCYGGTNGGNGRGAGNPSAWSAAYYGNGGKGQGTPTTEFGESSGQLYASGGQGAGRGTVAPSRSVTANTGNGGAGGLGYAAATTEQQKGISGASGIIIIRNKR